LFTYLTNKILKYCHNVKIFCQGLVKYTCANVFNFDFFFQMMKNVDKVQADRIFRACDTSGDNKISLDEFRKMVERGKD